MIREKSSGVEMWMKKNHRVSIVPIFLETALFDDEHCCFATDGILENPFLICLPEFTHVIEAISPPDYRKN